MAAVLSGAAFATLQQAARAEPAQVRLVDRTLVCRTGVMHGARTITVVARSGFRGEGRLEELAAISVVTPGQPIPSRPNYLPTLVGVSAGWPPPEAFATGGGLAFSTGRCKATRARAPLTRRGLRGGRANVFGEEATCSVPAEVLVRVRATFLTPTTLEPLDRTAGVAANGRIELGRIAVRTRTGRQLAYADVTDSGRARIFTAPNCT